MINIFIPAHLLSEKTRTTFNEGNLAENIIIDYATNNLYSYAKNSKENEFEVFNFNRYLTLDNRYSNYEVNIVKHSQHVLAGISVSIYKTL